MFNVVCFDEFGWASFQDWSAYGMFVGVELFEHDWKRRLFQVAHRYSLTEMDVSEGIDVHSFLIGEILV